jgi:hypothetical protein
MVNWLHSTSAGEAKQGKNMICDRCGKEKPETGFARRCKSSYNLIGHGVRDRVRWCYSCVKESGQAGPTGRPMSAFVYLIRVVGTNSVKIGITTNLEQRLLSFHACNPFPLEVLYSQWYEYASVVEGDLHVKYASKNIHFEWFTLDDDDIEDIKAYMIGVG